ncbi:MAG: hypothetical protein JO057_22060 [Chloroflexi bacterium]|nr:hypothetical protein [Chloroflexota bacterium]
MRRSESGALFVERALAVHPGFELDERTAAAVANICRGLDGLPLAIELAAAPLRVLAVKQIAERLHQTLSLLEAEHDNARTALRWMINHGEVEPALG